METEHAKDIHVRSVCWKITKRAELGLNKYGVTTERTDLTELDWLLHAQQEAMDCAIYLEVLIQRRLKPENPQRSPAVFSQSP